MIYQAGVRRNGLHAVRGWAINMLKVCGPDAKFTDGRSLEGVSWFNWIDQAYTVDEVIERSNGQPWVTLESFPLERARAIAATTGDKLVIQSRSLRNWLASSYMLSVKRGSTHLAFEKHRHCINVWWDYAKEKDSYDALYYDRWVQSQEYRIRAASRLFATPYTGQTYDEVHGIEGSSFTADGNTHSVLTRYLILKNDEGFQNLLEDLGI